MTMTAKKRAIVTKIVMQPTFERMIPILLRSLKIATPILILLAGIVMMTFGILRGELQMILNKAVLVCLECIGIG